MPLQLLVALMVVVVSGPPSAGVDQTILSAATGPKIAIIVGPNGPRTVENRDRANAAAREALLYTSNVVKVYSPNATWAPGQFMMPTKVSFSFSGYSANVPFLFRKSDRQLTDEQPRS